MANSNTKCSNERKIREEIVSGIIDRVVRESWYTKTKDYYYNLYQYFTNGNASVEHVDEGIVFKFRMINYGETISKVDKGLGRKDGLNKCLATFLCRDSSSDPAIFKNANTQPLHYTIDLELFPKDMILRLYDNVCRISDLEKSEFSPVDIKDIDLNKARSVEVKIVFSYNAKYSGIGFLNNLKDGGHSEFNKLVYDLSSEFNASLFKKIYFDLHVETSIFEKYHVCGSLYSKDIYRSFSGYTDESKVGIFRTLDRIISMYIYGSGRCSNMPMFNVALHTDVLSVAPIDLAVNMLNAKSHILRDDGRFVGIPTDDKAIIDTLKELPFMWELEKYRESENLNNNISTCIVKRSNRSVSERHLYVSVPLKNVKRYFSKIEGSDKYWMECGDRIIPGTVIPVFCNDECDEHDFPKPYYAKISNNGKCLVVGYAWADVDASACRDDAQALEEMFFNA